ncbi:hypothetical protein, partial [Roseiarcus sp.]|uniref:hypothetical protein n=1 Tax=Roseiarcus sp. TaxID=1969460 RepID=UPI003F9A5320
MEWYAPLLVIIYIVNDDNDVNRIVLLFCWCSLLVAIIGVLDFVLKKRLFVSIMPKALVSSLAANNPAFYQMITQ